MFPRTFRSTAAPNMLKNLLITILINGAKVNYWNFIIYRLSNGLQKSMQSHTNIQYSKVLFFHSNVTKFVASFSSMDLSTIIQKYPPSFGAGMLLI